MKKLNTLLMVVTTATLIFSSCSQQRYSSRAKVRVNQQTKEQLVEAPKEVAAITPKNIDITQPEVIAPEANQAQKPESIAPTPTKREVLKKLRSEESKTMLKNIAQDPTKLKDIITKGENVTKKEFKEKTGLEARGQWLSLIIIGLVLLLIGFLLPQPLGGIFNLVGSILIVIGLIFFLLELL